MPADLWRAGRAAVLRRLLEAETLYPDPAFRARFEALARENIWRDVGSFDRN